MPSEIIKGHVVFFDEEDRALIEMRWSINNGYAIRSVKPKQMHRIILERKIGRPLEEGEVCDHIDGNRLNNSRSNLRVATHTQNIWNSKPKKGNTTGYKGVYVVSSGRRWGAMINIDGKMVNLGRFNDIREAAKAYNEAAIKQYGEFARLNVIPDVDPYEELKTLSDDQIRYLSYMTGGGVQFTVRGHAEKHTADELVEMGLATRTVKTRIEEYVLYEATEAGRNLLHPIKKEK